MGDTVQHFGNVLHAMLRVTDLDRSLQFYCDGLGMRLLAQREYPEGEFTLAFVGFGDPTEEAVLELTYNWGEHSYEHGTAFGHIAIGVGDLFETCEQLRQRGVPIIREPGPMKFGSVQIAFVEDPDGYKLELVDAKSYAGLFQS